MKHILLVNPWIYDFAAYDLWLKPWGLLKLSSIFKRRSYKVSLIDALDRHHPFAPLTLDKDDGSGKYYSEIVDSPEVLKGVPRRFRRYGLPLEAFHKSLPDEDVGFILVSSGMTYWYKGAHETIKILRDKYSQVPIILGGVYATLCYEHAVETSGADYVIKNTDLNKLNEIIRDTMPLSDRAILDEPIDLDGYEYLSYAVLRLSLGCPFDCTYCAQKKLSNGLLFKDMQLAFEEFAGIYDRGVRDYAFYDDALFFNNKHIKRYLKKIINAGMEVKFHSPNGLHARFIDIELAELMRKSTFVGPRLSVETSLDDKHDEWHNKISSKEFAEAVSNLRAAGYNKGEYSAYVLLGAPGTTIDEVKKTVDYVHSLGAKIYLSEYSPIPGTKMSDIYGYDEEEPLLHNNSIFPYFREGKLDEINNIKNYTVALNRKLVT